MFCSQMCLYVEGAEFMCSMCSPVFQDSGWVREEGVRDDGGTSRGKQGEPISPP